MTQDVLGHVLFQDTDTNSNTRYPGSSVMLFQDTDMTQDVLCHVVSGHCDTRCPVSCCFRTLTVTRDVLGHVLFQDTDSDMICPVSCCFRTLTVTQDVLCHVVSGH